MADALDKGHQLEEEVERIFQSGGYATQRNVVRTGRSGARHEIDVLAEKSDGLTSFVIACECKAWSHRVDKDVVAKAAFIASDLGITKVIVVGLVGSTIGAEQSAGELGVELWGPEELERRLGQASVAALAHPPAGPSAVGFRVAVGVDVAERVVERERSNGVLGFGKEEILWLKLVWVPCLVFEVGYSRIEGRLRKRTKGATVLNLHEAVTGGLLGRFSALSLEEVPVGGNRIPAQVKSRTFRTETLKAFEKWHAVVQAPAKQRYAAVLAARGIPMPFDAITMDEVAQPHRPVYMALLQTKDAKKRVVCVDGVTGQLAPALATALTGKLSFVTSAIAA